MSAELSADELATLRDIIATARARRSRSDSISTGATVQQHAWSPQEAVLSARKNDLRSQQALMERVVTIYEPDHPTVRAVRKKLEEIEQSVAELEAAL